MSETGQPGAATPGEHGDGTGQRDDLARSGNGWSASPVDWSWGPEVVPGSDVTGSRSESPSGWATASSRHADLPAPVGEQAEPERPVRVNGNHVNGHQPNGAPVADQSTGGRHVPVSAPCRCRRSAPPPPASRCHPACTHPPPNGPPTAGSTAGTTLFAVGRTGPPGPSPTRSATGRHRGRGTRTPPPTVGPVRRRPGTSEPSPSRSAPRRRDRTSRFARNGPGRTNPVATPSPIRKERPSWLRQRRSDQRTVGPPTSVVGAVARGAAGGGAIRSRRPSRPATVRGTAPRRCCRSASPPNRTCPSCRSRQLWSHPPKPRN